MDHKKIYENYIQPISTVGGLIVLSAFGVSCFWGKVFEDGSMSDKTWEKCSVEGLLRIHEQAHLRLEKILKAQEDKQKQSQMQAKEDNIKCEETVRKIRAALEGNPAPKKTTTSSGD